MWDEPGKLLQPGDIVRLTKGYASIWRQSLTLYAGKNGEILKIGEFCMLFNEQLNMSEPNQNFGNLVASSIVGPVVIHNGNGGSTSIASSRILPTTTLVGETHKTITQQSQRYLGSVTVTPPIPETTIPITSLKPKGQSNRISRTNKQLNVKQERR